MRKTLSILYILLISHLLLANNVSLDWSDNKIITIGEDSVEVPYFTEANYVDASMLPYYQYSKPLSKDEALGFEYDVSIINIKSGSINAAIDLYLLDENYKVESNISCARGVYALEIRILPLKYDNGIFRL